MSILTQFEKLTPEEINLIYDTIETSIKYHKSLYEDWVICKELVTDFNELENTDKYFNKINETSEKFKVVLNKLNDLKELINE